MTPQLFWLILIPVFAGGAIMLCPLCHARRLVVAVQTLVTALSYYTFHVVRQQGAILQNVGGWGDYVGITLRADRLAVVMVLMTAVLYWFMLLYNLRREYANNLFLMLFLVMQGLIFGIFLSNDLFNLFVLVEVSTVVISILIMYKKDSQAIYDGMLYLLINLVSMSFFLFGTGIIYKFTGVVDMYGIREVLRGLDSARPVILPYAFLVTAVSLKSALMPLFSWLPKAHGTPSAPSVVSAVLSGIYVKTGLYMFLRIQETFAPVLDTSQLFLYLGFITAVAGFVLAVAQKDLKLILAYHTVSQVGLIMMGINMGGEQNFIGGVYHIVNHAFFKSTLFLTAGMVIDTYKTRNVYEIEGVFRRMPLVGIATIMAILGITGAPFFNGSISKYWIAYGTGQTWAEYGLLLVNFGTILSFVKYSRIFFGGGAYPRESLSPIRERVVLGMGLVCLLGGVLGAQLIGFLFDVDLNIQALSYVGKTITFVLTLAAGVALYHLWLKKNKVLEKLKKLELGFNGVSATITIYFFFLLVYLTLTTA